MINDPADLQKVSSDNALRYHDDDQRREYERHAGALEAALRSLEGRNDERAAFARPKLEAEAVALRKEMDRAEALSPALEKAREAYRESIAECEQASDACRSAETGKALVLARADLEIAGRVALQKRLAFAELATKARLSSLTSREYFKGWRLSLNQADTSAIARHGRFLVTLDLNVGGLNSAQSALARDRVYGSREMGEAQLCWEIAAEGGVAAEVIAAARAQHIYVADPEIAFQYRWFFWCQRRGIECSPPATGAA